MFFIFRFRLETEESGSQALKAAAHFFIRLIENDSAFSPPLRFDPV